jgi:hypothetical protein
MEFVLEKAVNHCLKAYFSTICNIKNAAIARTVYTFHTILWMNDCFPKNNKPTCLRNTDEVETEFHKLQALRGWQNTAAAIRSAAATRLNVLYGKGHKFIRKLYCM